MVGVLARIFLQGFHQDEIDNILLWEKNHERFFLFLQMGQRFGLDLFSNFSDVLDFGQGKGPCEFFLTQRNFLDLGFFESLIGLAANLFICLNENLFCFGTNDILADGFSDKILRQLPKEMSVFRKYFVSFMEETNDFFIGSETESSQEDARQEFFLAV